MKAEYLIANPKQGTWGRGETIKEALEKCQFTMSQDKVAVFLVDSTAYVTEVGSVAGRFVTELGLGKVRADKKRVAMDLEGDSPTVRFVEENLVKNIQEVLDGREWDSDTPQIIAEMMSSAGFEIRSTDNMLEKED